MFTIRIALAIFCILVLLVIALQNSDVVEIQFLVWNADVSLVALVFLTSATGLVLGFVLGRIGRTRKRSK